MNNYITLKKETKTQYLAEKINMSVDDFRKNYSIQGDSVDLDDAFMILEDRGLYGICFDDIESLQKSFTSLSSHDNLKNMKSIKPVISVMGHINHGKTSLLEKLINKNICNQEVSEITQDVSVYNHEKYWIIDTPGHRFFNRLRLLIEPICTLVVVVISLVKNIQEETEHVLNNTHKVFRIICGTKEDLVSNAEERMLDIQEKCENDFDVTKKVFYTTTSINNSNSIKEFEQNLIKKTQEINAQTSSQCIAIGYIINEQISNFYGKGYLIYLSHGTLLRGQSFCYSGQEYIIKKIISIDGKILKKTCGGDFVIISFNDDIEVKLSTGERFFALESRNDVKRVCHIQQEYLKKDTKKQDQQQALDVKSSDKVEERLKIILITNTATKTETLEKVLMKYDIIRSKTDITIRQNDIDIAIKKKATIILWGKMKSTKKLDKAQVSYVTGESIYKILEYFKTVEDAKVKENILGSARIKAIFKMKETVLGCDVIDGIIRQGAKCKIYDKKENLLFDNIKITSLQFERNTQKEVQKGRECGIVLRDLKEEFEIGYKIICYEVV